MSKNAYFLLSCLATNSIASIFTYSFLLAFLLDISQNGIVNVALFYLVMHITMICLTWLLAPFFKKVSKTLSLRLGAIMKLGFVVMVVFLYDNIINYIWIISICNAFAEVLFWGGANPLQPMIVKRKSLTYYMSIIKIVGTIISLVFPILIGIMIDAVGIYVISIIMLVMVTIQFVLATLIKYDDVEVNTKLNFREFSKSIGDEKHKVKHIYVNQLLYGFCSNMSMLTLYYTVVTFGTNVSIGIFSTLTSILSIVMLAVFNLNRKLFANYNVSALYSILVCLGMILIMFIPNKITVTLFYILWNLTIVVPDTVTSSKRLNIINHKNLKKFNIENITISESFLDLGRVIGEFMILIVGIVNSRALDIVMLGIMAIMVLIYYFHVVYIQKNKLRSQSEILNDAKISEQ